MWDDARRATQAHRVDYHRRHTAGLWLSHRGTPCLPGGYHIITIFCCTWLILLTLEEPLYFLKSPLLQGFLLNILPIANSKNVAYA